MKWWPGEPPFKGKTDSHTRVSIIDHEPVPLVQHVSNVPRQLERIVSKALAKDRLKRYQTITDLKLDLEQLRDELHTSDSFGANRDAEVAPRKRICSRQRRRLSEHRLTTVAERSDRFEQFDWLMRSRARNARDGLRMACWDCWRC